MLTSVFPKNALTVSEGQYVPGNIPTHSMQEDLPFWEWQKGIQLFGPILQHLLSGPEK